MGTRELKVGIIGGSGFYELEGLESKQLVSATTEFGAPSDELVTGRIGGVQCVVLARHGKGHRINPTEVNYRANVRAMKQLGVTHILAATACGSLREELVPGDLVVLDSFIDRTTKRHQTFHDQSSAGAAPDLGSVCHVAMCPAFCERTRKVLLEEARSMTLAGATVHDGGTMVTIEGPRFSSRAESRMFRAWGGDVINMTTVPEVVLAAEAGISYASVAMVTDFDCWRESDEPVTQEKVMTVIKKNISNVKALFARTVANMGEMSWDKTITANEDKAARSVLP